MNYRKTMSRIYNNKQVILVAVLVLLAVLARMFMQGLPNIEPITLAALLGITIFKKNWAFVLPLAIVAVSDSIIGNSSILLFTWSAWLIVGLISLLIKKAKQANWSFVFKFTGVGLLANLVFYLWTNFGVWLLGTMYTKNIVGLIESYIMGIPFLKYQLFGNLIILPVASAGVVLSVKLKLYEDQKIKIKKTSA